MKISKELLSEVLGYEALPTQVSTKELQYIDKRRKHGAFHPCRINIYELAHKNLKEWALKQGYYLHSHTKEYNDCWCIVKSLDNITQQLSCKMDTEVEAIIKACTYILNTLSNK